MTMDSWGAKGPLPAWGAPKSAAADERFFHRTQKERVRLRVKRCWTLMSTLPPAPAEGEQRRF